MKILHTSDWHVGRTIRGRSRVDEHRAVLAEMAVVAAAHAVDLVVVAGDLFDAATPAPESEQVVYRALLDLAEVAPVVVIAGNHDNPRRLEAVAPLLQLGRVRVASFVTRPDEGGVISDLGLPVRVALLPWQGRKGIVSAADLMAKDPDQHAQDFEARLRLVIDALCGGMGADTVNLVVAHLSVHGARVAGSERSAHLFQYAVPAGAFPGHLSYVALGHFHRPQQVLAPAPVWYSGSPLQLDFGEAGEDKMVMLVEAEPGLPAAITSVPLTSGRRLVRLSGTLEQVAAVAGEVGDAFVRVELDEPARVGLADEVRRLLPEVVDVILARPAAEGETPPVRIGRNPRELFAEYLRGRGGDDPALLDLFDELVEEAHEA